MNRRRAFCWQIGTLKLRTRKLIGLSHKSWREVTVWYRARKLMASSTYRVNLSRGSHYAISCILLANFLSGPIIIISLFETTA